jgi:hypothetical protein
MDANSVLFLMGGKKKKNRKVGYLPSLSTNVPGHVKDTLEYLLRLTQGLAVKEMEDTSVQE